ncbi:MAG: peptidoglycan DD-metalloendopeptidase family protein [Clostridia bacterium]|nr:peptidoglycan DD-metalloendopeptidase family protein [Clostridia bacterium]
MIVIAFGFVSGILCVKYKPVYAVTIGNENVGYIDNKEEFEQKVEDLIINYSSKNVDSVELNQTPSYELKFVDKNEQTNEQEIIIAMQKDVTITYKYYEIALDNEVIESVDKKEDAESIVSDLKSTHDEDLNLTISEKITQNIEEIKTDEVEVAKSNISTVIEENENTIADVEGIKIACLPVTGIISSRYAESSSIRSSTHTGLDIAAPSGTDIQVVADGTVTCASYNGSYGNLVKVDHGNGVETWYAHTSKMYVTVGQEVKAGDIIASVGSTGNSTGPHLHFEIRINGNHVNPQNYLYN